MHFTRSNSGFESHLPTYEPSFSTSDRTLCEGLNDPANMRRTSSSLSRSTFGKAQLNTSITEDGSGQRPQMVERVHSIKTQYMEMLLHLDKIPRLHNILAATFTWILLAGFLVIPGTFTTLKNSTVVKNAESSDGGNVADAIVKSIANIGLLWISVICSSTGALGMCWLWWVWHQNYVWLVNRIFLPGLLNSIAGLLTTIVNVYTAQKGIFSITAKVTAIVTGTSTGITAILFVLYNNWILKRVRDTHDQELKADGFGSPVERIKRFSIALKRKAQQSSMAPGSVI